MWYSETSSNALVSRFFLHRNTTNCAISDANVRPYSKTIKADCCDLTFVFMDICSYLWIFEKLKIFNICVLITFFYVVFYGYLRLFESIVKKIKINGILENKS